MPVSGPMAGSGRRWWPLPFFSGCTRKVARPSSSLRRKSSPRPASCQSCTTMYSSSSCRNSSAGFSKRRIDFHEVGQHPQRFQVLGLALLESGEQPLDRCRWYRSGAPTPAQSILSAREAGRPSCAAHRSAAALRRRCASAPTALPRCGFRSTVMFSSSSCRCAMTRKGPCGRLPAVRAPLWLPVPRAATAPPRGRSRPGTRRSGQAGSAAPTPRPSAAAPPAGRLP